MTIPRYSQLSPGVTVSIVLKVDQPTGKLTTGRVADILTRGDHPRGIKVRLQGGQIGRVQSLSAAATTSVQAEVLPVLSSTAGLGAVPQLPRRGLQDDYRNDPVPVETRSLEDYIKKPSRNKRKGQKAKVGDEEPPVAVESEQSMTDPHQQLKTEFPGIDSALVAAIVNDYGADLDGARTVLRGLG